jgi:hypothetical protein
MQNILYLATWFINILFWAGFIPQIILNFRLKTAKGMSDIMLFSIINGYITYTYYVLCCDLPMAFKIMSPVSLATVIIMLIQRFAYDKYSIKLFVLYVANMIVGLLFIPYAFSKTLLVGNVMGWISASIWAVYALPQMIKITMERSVVGFSFLFVSLVGFGDIIQSVIAIALKLPSQTLFNGLRGTLVYLIFCLQFLLYKKSKEIRYRGAVIDYDSPKIEKQIESGKGA